MEGHYHSPFTIHDSQPLYTQSRKIMREIAISEIGQAQAGAAESEETFHMDEESFRGFYERTARSLWAYLSRASGDPSLADDLLQDTYYRFLRAALPETTEAHRKNYLFRIATNLLRDHWRRHKPTEPLPSPQSGSESGAEWECTRAFEAADRMQQQSDLRRALHHLKPREREMLWMAYVEGFSHKEIANAVGLKAGSIRLLLFRARHKLAGLLNRSQESGVGSRETGVRGQESE
jgi:RNA polymerase sigma-70 factor, ECF subfamily